MPIPDHTDLIAVVHEEIIPYTHYKELKGAEYSWGDLAHISAAPIRMKKHFIESQHKANGNKVREYTSRLKKKFYSSKGLMRQSYSNRSVAN